MKVFINCPICNDPLDNSYSAKYLDGEILFKNCRQHSYHIFSCAVYYPDTDREYVERTAFTLSMSPPLSIMFVDDRGSGGAKSAWIKKSYPTPQADLTNGREKMLELPYWEPDLSDYPKLIKKIKIYLLFS